MAFRIAGPWRFQRKHHKNGDGSDALLMRGDDVIAWEWEPGYGIEQNTQRSVRRRNWIEIANTMNAAARRAATEERG